MILINEKYKNIVIATSRNIEQKYDFYFSNDISKKEITTSLQPSSYNSRYMEFDIEPSTLHLETGYGKIIIKDKDREIYNDIYLYEWEEKDEYVYEKEDTKFVYKRK